MLDVVLRMNILVGMSNAILIHSETTGTIGGAANLYEACKAIVGNHNMYVTVDGRPVAFYDAYRQEVRPMFAALPAERAQIQADVGLLVTA